jgi:protoporphyrinogen oxidase
MMIEKYGVLGMIESWVSSPFYTIPELMSEVHTVPSIRSTTAVSDPTLVIGAGPAGLTAAYRLTSDGIPVVVLEQSDQVGGIARTELYRGYRFDIGGHRFFTQLAEIEALWRDLLGPDLLERPRKSRIYFDGRYYDYPLQIWSTLQKLGLRRSLRAGLSYLKAQLGRKSEKDTFEAWVTQRFGRYLYELFFKTYTEKVWGLSGRQIHAAWAAQRIQGLSLPVAIRNALGRRSSSASTSLITQFLYPRLGPGMMWEAAAKAVIRQGGEVRCGFQAVALSHHGGVVQTVTVRSFSGQLSELPCRQVLSSMPLPALLRALDPAPPDAVLAAGDALNYRDFITVLLIVDARDLFPDNWLYIHEPDVQVGRIQNFKNWSPEMVPDPTMTSLGLEYFCEEGDSIWEQSDAELIALAKAEVVSLGLATPNQVLDGTVARQRKAYPVYSRTYPEKLAIIQRYLGTFRNLQTIGRNGLHKYNNQDHSMLTAIQAVENIAGQRHNLWATNTERSYNEEIRIESEPG